MQDDVQRDMCPLLYSSRDTCAEVKDDFVVISELAVPLPQQCICFVGRCTLSPLQNHLHRPNVRRPFVYIWHGHYLWKFCSRLE